MILGMTGFGSGRAVLPEFKVDVEIKSLNHRYLDAVYYLPSGMSALENKIRPVLQRSLERGRVTVSVRVVQKTLKTVKFNKEIVRHYIDQGNILKKEFGLANDLTLSHIISLPGVVELSENTLDIEKVWTVLEKCIEKALKELVSMRKAEGKSLLADIKDKLTRMTLQIKIIQKQAKAILELKKKELPKEEFSSFQKSNDINEELSRLAHYISEMNVLLKASVSSGKKFDFIAQEMQRETNTIGSKLQDKVVSNAVIALKSKIEKIREQSQNIE